MTDREAMKLALENICGAILCEINPMSSRKEMLRLMDEAIAALHQALEQPRQECETCANKRRRLEQAGFLKSPLRGEEKQFFSGQDPNVLPTHDKGESRE